MLFCCAASVGPRRAADRRPLTGKKSGTGCLQYIANSPVRARNDAVRNSAAELIEKRDARESEKQGYLKPSQNGAVPNLGAGSRVVGAANCCTSPWPLARVVLLLIVPHAHRTPCFRLLNLSAKDSDRPSFRVFLAEMDPVEFECLDHQADGMTTDAA
jgi:hypothetical protein